MIFTIFFSSIFVGGWHPAAQITPGIFSVGNFSFDGSFGIGLTNPINAKLDILSTTGRGIWANSTTDDGVAGITNASGKSAVYGLASNGAYSGYFEDGDFIVMNGNVGIGTSSPIVKFQVNGSGDTAVRVTSIDNAAAFQIDRGATNKDGQILYYTTGILDWRIRKYGWIWKKFIHL